jgi:hypothetical protein
MERINNILVLFILVITCLKLTLIGKGFLAFPDEFIYRSSERALKSLLNGDARSALYEIFSTQGRPGEALVKMIPCAFQMVTASVFNVSYAENTYPMFFFNFIVHCLLLLVHYKFSKLLLKDKFLALTSLLLYTALTNSFIYLRHILPYDTSLLVFYYVLYRVVKGTDSGNLKLMSSFFLGLLSFFGLVIYPGYFPLYLAGGAMLFFNKMDLQNLKNRFYNAGMFILGGTYCLILAELISNYSGRSYIADSIILSGNITQGSFEESFSFIIKYLFEVEGIPGMILATGVAGFLMIFSFKFNQGITASAIILLFALLFSIFISYACLGYFKHNVVFYGRLLHQYYPFLCLFTVFAFNGVLERVKRSKMFLMNVSGLFIVVFGINLWKYHQFSYPRDIAFRYNREYVISNRKLVFEYGTSVAAFPSEDELIFPVQSEKKANTFSEFTMVNFCYFYPAEDPSLYHEYIPGSGSTLISSGSYFLNNKAYQYEGFNIAERENISGMNLHIKVYGK